MLSTETRKENDTRRLTRAVLSCTAICQVIYCLLTGDAGIRALTEACDFVEATSLPLRQFNFSQAPHHGSRHNVSPSLLTAGRSEGRGGQKIGHTAFVSAAQKIWYRSTQVATNAYTRGGVSVYRTDGGTISRARQRRVQQSAAVRPGQLPQQDGHLVGL